MKLLNLFVDFFIIGSFTFGGGWSIVAQMQRLYVEKRKIMTNEELLDITAVGRSLPGMMTGHIVMMFGYKQAGYLGGVVSVIGLCMPPMLIISLITIFDNEFRNNYWISTAMKGIRYSIVPIIILTALPMFKTVNKSIVSILLIVCTLVAYMCGVNMITLILIGTCSGVIQYFVNFKGE